MKELIKGKFKSEFVKNVAVMFSGNGLALVFPLIMGPFISRLYSPDDFAGFELFVKIVAMLAVISCFRLEQAIILPKLQSEADALFKLSFKILIAISVVSLVLVWPFKSQIGELLQNETLPELLWLLPLAVFVTGAYQLFTAYGIRLRKFKKLASNKILAAISNNGSKYILGMRAPNSLNLVWGQIIGTVIPVLAFLQIKTLRETLRGVFRQEVPSKVLLKKYRDFPIVNSSHAFFDEAQRATLLFVISAYYGSVVLGLFAFGLRYLKVPLQVFGSSLSQVLNEKWARDLNNGINIRGAVVKMVLVLFGISIIPFTILFFFGTPIFAFVFGDEWAVAGTYAAALAPWLLANFLVSPISFLPILANKQKTSFAIAVVGNLLILLFVFGLSIQGATFETVILGLVAGNTIHLAVVLGWFIHISGNITDRSYQ